MLARKIVPLAMVKFASLDAPMTSNAKAEGRFGKQDFRYVAEDDVYKGAVQGFHDFSRHALWTCESVGRVQVPCRNRITASYLLAIIRVQPIPLTRAARSRVPRYADRGRTLTRLCRRNGLYACHRRDDGPVGIVLTISLPFGCSADGSRYIDVGPVAEWKRGGNASPLKPGSNPGPGLLFACGVPVRGTR